VTTPLKSKVDQGQLKLSSCVKCMEILVSVNYWLPGAHLIQKKPSTSIIKDVCNRCIYKFIGDEYFPLWFEAKNTSLLICSCCTKEIHTHMMEEGADYVLFTLVLDSRYWLAFHYKCYQEAVGSEDLFI